ncbi:septum formation family protein [Micromonospora sp. 4G57]|uniref:Septum formation family protein n=1 Tax=Micromonospora sicca TaxID=2202420 RepID=A0ABU5J7A2_9ACTN|nr:MULTISPECIES: septum formation family protein [unclassified Micromonospora]MDZ5444736.1 septum formation family protein [Micromonospora sp. 4G57]MDZ5488463.1 septum formation family protein [Micromonospora sp. 4G53]
MRRWLRAVALGAVAVLALAGYGGPAGLDGNLVDDWPAMSAPQGFVPEAGTCHVHADASLNAYAPVPCESAHRLETMHVGALTGSHASRGTPPTFDSAAHAECDRKVNKALGGDWRSGRLTLDVLFPTALGWQGGARWFRCDLAELERFDDRAVVTRTASLTGALRGDSTLAHRCFNPKLAEYAPRRELAEGDLQGMDAVPCTTAHHAEFVGVYQAPPDIDLRTYRRSTEPIRRQCLALIARFAKVPNDGDLKNRTGWLYWLPNAQSWTDGNRTVQCFLWLDDRTVTRSVKGAGPKALPAR